MIKKKTGHHYIPNGSYLANFSDTSGKVWVLDANDKIYNTNPSNIFKEQNFYTIKLDGGGGSLVVEDTLANIEGVFASIFREKISAGLTLTLQEKASVSVFLAALYLRTKSYRKGMSGALGQIHSGMKEWKTLFENNKDARDFSAATMSTSGESISMEDIEYALTNSKELHSTSMMDNLAGVAQLIFSMDWQYLPAPEGEIFVTSETPFRVLRPEAIKKYGLNAIGSSPGLIYKDSEITVPLSSSLALYGAYKGVGDGVLEINKKQLDQVNYRTMMYSSDKIVACKPDVLEEVKNKIAKNNSLSD